MLEQDLRCRQNAKLWDDTRTVDGVINLVNTWLITLEKQGCATMLKAGDLLRMQTKRGRFVNLRDDIEIELSRRC